MFGLGLPELAIILVVVIFILGPKKLPELGAAIAKTLRGFKEEANAIEDEHDRK
jgi:sec-independent protein translocase protein TatA